MCDVIGVGEIWGRLDCQAVVYTNSHMWMQRFVIAKVSQELAGSSFSAEERIGLWEQSTQQSCPWPVTVPTGRVTDGDRSSFTDNPLIIPQQKCSSRTPTVRCFSSRPVPPMPSSRWRTATSKKNRHHGKELGNESGTCLCKRGGWPDVQGKNTMQQVCVLLQTVTKCKPSCTLTCLQIMSSSKEVQQTYTGCPKRNGQNFGRVFLRLNYTDITQNTYIQSW